MPVDANTMPNAFCFVLGIDLFFIAEHTYQCKVLHIQQQIILRGKAIKKKKTVTVLATHYQLEACWQRIVGS